MGIVSDKLSDDQTIHPDYAKVAGKTCHITLKYHLNWMIRVKEELEEITLSGFIKMDFFQLDSIVYSMTHTSTMINLGLKEAQTAGVSIFQL